MMKLLKFLFDNPLGKLVSAGVGIAALAGAYWVHVEQQRSIGAKRALTKVEGNNEALRARASDAGRKSIDPNVRGVLNPYYRAD